MHGTRTKVVRTYAEDTINAKEVEREWFFSGNFFVEKMAAPFRQVPLPLIQPFPLLLADETPYSLLQGVPGQSQRSFLIGKANVPYPHDERLLRSKQNG